MRIAVILTNYNMPERADALCERVLGSEWPVCLFCVDNGSDLVAPARFTNVWLDENVQTTWGWLAGLEVAHKVAREYGPFFAYLFLITSTEFVEGVDPIPAMAELMLSDPDVVGVHPALTADSTCDWPHLFKLPGREGPRETWHIDNICSLYRADWFDGIGWFSPDLTFAWGVDLETCWKARRDGGKLMVHDGVQVRKITDIGYKMGRMNMTADERRLRASQEMQRVLSARYGVDCWERMTGQFVSEGMLLPGEWRGRERASDWGLGIEDC